MLPLVVISYLKEIYNLSGKFCSDSVLSLKIKGSNKCLFIFFLLSFSATALCLPLSGADISVLSVINWSQRLGKRQDLFWHTLSFRGTLHIKSNLVLPLAKKKKKNKGDESNVGRRFFLLVQCSVDTTRKFVTFYLPPFSLPLGCFIQTLKLFCIDKGFNWCKLGGGKQICLLLVLLMSSMNVTWLGFGGNGTGIYCSCSAGGWDRAHRTAQEALIPVLHGKCHGCLLCFVYQSSSVKLKTTEPSCLPPTSFSHGKDEETSPVSAAIWQTC